MRTDGYFQEGILKRYRYSKLLVDVPLACKDLALGRSRKDPQSPHGGNFCRPEGEGRKNCF